MINATPSAEKRPAELGNSARELNYPELQVGRNVGLFVIDSFRRARRSVTFLTEKKREDLPPRNAASARIQALILQQTRTFRELLDAPCSMLFWLPRMLRYCGLEGEKESRELDRTRQVQKFHFVSRRTASAVPRFQQPREGRRFDPSSFNPELHLAWKFLLNSGGSFIKREAKTER